MSLPRNSEKSIHHLTFFTQLLSISVQCFLVLSLYIRIFCSCSLARTFCVRSVVSPASARFWCCHGPRDHPWEGLYWNPRLGRAIMYPLGKVIKREENVDTDNQYTGNCLQRISACISKEPTKFCKEVKIGLNVQELWYFLNVFSVIFFCHSLPIIDPFCL